MSRPSANVREKSAVGDGRHRREASRVLACAAVADKGDERHKRVRAERASETRKVPRAKSGDSRGSRARPHHQDGDYEALLQEAEKRGWWVTKDKGYFKCRCPCADHHYVSVVLTPGKQRTLINTRKNFERMPCWKEAMK